MRKRIFLLLLSWVFAASLLDCRRSIAAGPVSVLKVYVTCYGNDDIGARVCFAVKETLRASSGFQLIESPAGGAVGLHLTSTDIPVGQAVGPSQGLASALAAAFTEFDPNVVAHQYYLADLLYIVGRNRIDTTADSVMANLEKDTDFMRRWK